MTSHHSPERMDGSVCVYLPPLQLLQGQSVTDQPRKVIIYHPKLKLH